MLRAELRAALRMLGDLERLVNRVISGHAQPQRPDRHARHPARACQDLQRLFKDNSARAAAGDGSTSTSARTSWTCWKPPSATTRPPPCKTPASSAPAIPPNWMVSSKPRAMRANGSPTWKPSNASAPASRPSRWLQQGLRLLHRDHPRQPPTSAPAEYIRKQTLVNAERFITPEMKEYEALVLNAEERIHEIETRLFREICAQLASSSRASAGNRPRPGRTGCAGLAGRSRRAARLPPPELIDGYQPGNPTTAATRWSSRRLRGERFVPNDADL